MIDLIDPEEFPLKLRRNLDQKNALITKIYGAAALDFEEIYRNIQGMPINSGSM